MRIIIILLSTFLLISSCKNNKSNISGAKGALNLKELENAYEHAKSDSLATKLIYAYGHEISNSKSKDDKIQYLKKAIELTKTPGFEEFRIVFIKELIKTNPEGTSDELLTLGNIYEDEEKTDLQSIIFLGLKQRFPNNPGIKDINHKIFIKLGDHKSYFKNLLKDVFNDKANGSIDTLNAQKYIDQVSAFALGFAGDPTVPNYLMISADIARAIGDPNTSVGQYDWVYNYYPKYSKAPLALFLKGYEIDSSLKKYDDAKKTYMTFLQVYPNDSLAKDVKFLIKNLGKAPEEGFKEMQSIEQ